MNAPPVCMGIDRPSDDHWLAAAACASAQEDASAPMAADERDQRKGSGSFAGPQALLPPATIRWRRPLNVDGHGHGHGTPASWARQVGHGDIADRIDPDELWMTVTPGQTASLGSLTYVPGFGHWAKFAPALITNSRSLPGSLTGQEYSRSEL